MKTLEQIKSALEKEVIRFFDEGQDGLAVAVQKNSMLYKIIASWGGRWDHVSISLENRCPTWDEMCWAKDLFWNSEETVIQYHPSKSSYINNHPFCLHLWKPQHQTIPLPSVDFVGIKE